MQITKFIKIVYKYKYFDKDTTGLSSRGLKSLTTGKWAKLENLSFGSQANSNAFSTRIDNFEDSFDFPNLKILTFSTINIIKVVQTYLK